jgi:uncharacterized protein (TIGR00297 family)
MIDFIIISFFVAVAVIAGYYDKLLTLTGAIASFVIGLLIVLGMGIKGLIILVLFFVSSSLWSKVKSIKKKKAEELLVKGSQRDWQQVMANGGPAAMASALYYYTGAPIWLLGACICIAAANSDTWASEVGSMSKRRPISIKNFRRVDRGTSGAVSLLGTRAAVIGSLLIALASYLIFELRIAEFYFILLLGFTGNLIDTLLGAFVQAGYQCRNCGLKTEKTIHCGQNTYLITGYPFFNNDTVNFLSGFFTLIVGILILG